MGRVLVVEDDDRIAGLVARAAAITPNPAATPGSSTLKVTPTVRGTFTLTVTGTSGTIQHQAAVTLIVR